MTLYPTYTQAGRLRGSRSVWLHPATPGAQCLFVANAATGPLADLLVLALCAYIAAERLLATQNPPSRAPRRKALPAPRAKTLPSPHLRSQVSRLKTLPPKGLK